MPRFLHVANGTSVTGTLEDAGVPGTMSIWADPLHNGPVPAGLNDDELLVIRARYLAGTDDDAGAGEVIDGLRGWRAVIDADDAYDELVLWYEHDLFDQLNLIQILSWIRSRVPADKVSLICIGAFPGRPTFRGLGELSPDELTSLLPTRQPATGAQYEVADRAWRAFREPTPEPIEELRHADTSALPYLSRALTRFLQEYPSTSDGLSRSERRLLRLAEPQTIRLRAAFPQMHADEDAYYIDDATLADLIETLARTTPALVSAGGGNSEGETRLPETVSLTDAGREILAGRLDRVTCGIDRWLGGVHLQNGSVPWRWNDEQRRMTRA